MQTTAPDHPIIRKMQLYGELEPYEEIEEEKPTVFDDLISDVKFFIREAEDRQKLYQRHEKEETSKLGKIHARGAAFENDVSQKVLKEILNLLIETKEIEQAK